MIHTARQSPKFKKFVRRLRPHAQNSVVDVESIAVAILERLWHQTTAGAKAGDIGRYDNELIAEECGWLADADLLIEILVECKYLDRCEVHRLVVHDWHEHAPNHVKGVMKRRAEKGDSGWATQGSEPGQLPRSATQSSEPPNQTKPNLTNSNQTNDSDPRPGCDHVFEPPSAEEVQAYIDQQARANPHWLQDKSLTGEAFCDHYEAQGWIGGNGIPIRDWKAKVRSWGRNGTPNGKCKDGELVSKSEDPYAAW